MRVNNISSNQTFQGALCLKNADCHKAEISFEDMKKKAHGQVIQSSRMKEYSWLRFDNKQYENSVVKKLKDNGVIFVHVQGYIPYDTFQLMAKNNF